MCPSGVIGLLSILHHEKKTCVVGSCTRPKTFCSAAVAASSCDLGTFNERSCNPSTTAMNASPTSKLKEMRCAKNAEQNKLKIQIAAESQESVSLRLHLSFVMNSDVWYLVSLLPISVPTFFQHAIQKYSQNVDLPSRGSLCFSRNLVKPSVETWDTVQCLQGFELKLLEAHGSVKNRFYYNP